MSTAIVKLKDYDPTERDLEAIRAAEEKGERPIFRFGYVDTRLVGWEYYFEDLDPWHATVYLPMHLHAREDRRARCHCDECMLRCTCFACADD